MSNFKTRPEIFGEYLVQNNCTIRTVAKEFNISKSTVHLDLSKKLKRINLILYKNVKSILERNFAERNIRGGNATKLKYLALKLNNK